MQADERREGNKTTKTKAWVSSHILLLCPFVSYMHYSLYWWQMQLLQQVNVKVWPASFFKGSQYVHMYTNFVHWLAILTIRPNWRIGSLFYRTGRSQDFQDHDERFSFSGIWFPLEKIVFVTYFLISSQYWKNKVTCWKHTVEEGKTTI